MRLPPATEEGDIRENASRSFLDGEVRVGVNNVYSSWTEFNVTIGSIFCSSRGTIEAGESVVVTTDSSVYRVTLVALNVSTSEARVTVEVRREPAQATPGAQCTVNK